jgi:uncharacterized protein Yka (UPF0111/DUF47 family)
MGSETFSEFLIPLKFNLDEATKKKFDAAIAETEKRFKEIGKAATVAATALAVAVREISKNLSSLAYSAERVGASSEELKALGTAADRVGVGAEAAKSSLSGFFAFVNFEGGASAIKQWFGIGDLDPLHPLKAWLDSAVKLADEYANGSVPRRQTAIREAERAGINQTLLTTPGAARRLREEMAKDEAFTGGKLNPIAEKAKRLNAEFEKFSQHLKTISELVSGSLQDAFSDLLEEADGWLKAHRGDIIWFSNQAAELAKNILEVTKHEISLLARLEANTAELMRTQDIIKTIREGLKWLGEGSMANKINAALEWAFQPFKWLWDKLQSLGLVGPAVASTGDAATGSLGGGGGSETGLAGRAVGQSGGRSHLLGGGAEGKGGATANTPAAMAAAEAQLRAEGVPEANVHAAAALLVGQATAESGLDPTKVHDNGTGYGVYGARLKRRTAMFEWLSSHGFSKDSLEGQMKYMAHEAMTSKAYAATRRALMNATAGSIDRDTRIITPNFEVPKIDNSGVRVGFVRSALGKRASVANSLVNEHLPLADFHRALETIRAARPLTPWQQSMNEHHDNRVLNSNVEVKVAGAYPINKTAHPLERTKNATFIRNTTATAS